MTSFFDKAKKIIDKNQDMLIALEELDRTGRLKKTSYKKKVDFTIDEDVFHALKNYSRKTGIPMSRKVEELIKNGLD